MAASHSLQPEIDEVASLIGYKSKPSRVQTFAVVRNSKNKKGNILRHVEDAAVVQTRDFKRQFKSALPDLTFSS